MTDVSEGQKQLNICKEKLYAAVIADTLDTLGYHNQVLYPGLKALDNTLILKSSPFTAVVLFVV